MDLILFDSLYPNVMQSSGLDESTVLYRLIAYELLELRNNHHLPYNTLLEITKDTRKRIIILVIKYKIRHDRKDAEKFVESVLDFFDRIIQSIKTTPV